jgi:glycine oxidase
VTQPSSDVIVVGGGAIGAACTRELAASGRRVLVLDPGGRMGQAWHAAAGMLAPQIEADATDRLLQLGIAARDYYGPLAAALHESVGMDVGLWQEGIARVVRDGTEAEVLRTKVSWQQSRGHACQWIDTEEVARRWPWLAPTHGALWAPNDGALDPARLVEGLMADAKRMGAVPVSDRAIELRQERGKVMGIRGEAGSYSAPVVVLAAGAWTGLLQALPRAIPVRPVRGQMAALPWPAGIPRAIVYHKDSYILARAGEAVIGSTMEEAGFQPEVTSAGLASIYTATISLCPSLVRSKVRRTWAGLRPVTPDGLPIVAPEPLVEGLWYATGHGRNGILLAGLTGVIVQQLIDGLRPVFDLEAFSAERF